MDVVMLKEFSTTLTNPITKIINLSISQSMFPNVWKSAVVPVFKGGDPLSTCNLQTHQYPANSVKGRREIGS